MINVLKLVAKILDLTSKDEILWKNISPFGYCAEYEGIDIFVGYKSNWSVRYSLSINGVKVNGLSRKEIKQLSNAIEESFKRSNVRQEKKEKKSCHEAINILVAVE